MEGYQKIRNLLLNFVKDERIWEINEKRDRGWPQHLKLFTESEN